MSWTESESAVLSSFDATIGEQRRRRKDRLSARLELGQNVRTDVLLFAGLLPRMRGEGCPIRICTNSVERMHRTARELGANLQGVLICPWERYVQPPEKFVGRPDVLWQIADWEWGPNGGNLRHAGMALFNMHEVGFYHMVDLIRPHAPMVEEIRCDWQIFKQPWRPWPRRTVPY